MENSYRITEEGERAFSVCEVVKCNREERERERESVSFWLWRWRFVKI